MLNSKLAFRPFSSGGVVAKEEQGKGGDGDKDEWDDESHSPCHMRCEVLVLDEGVEDCWHDEVCDTATSVSPSASQGVR